jgi:hypothetical protein
VRRLITAVNVETAQVEIFDSYLSDLTPDHILASGSLPPGFPWTTINGNHYWDGGIVSNSPLEQVLERCGSAGKRVFIVDLFPSKKRLPINLLDVMVRRDEIVYSERVRNDLRTRALVRDFRKLVEEILSDMTADKLIQIKNKPRYIQLMGDVAPTAITRIIERLARTKNFQGTMTFRVSPLDNTSNKVTIGPGEHSDADRWRKPNPKTWIADKALNNKLRGKAIEGTVGIGNTND